MTTILRAFETPTSVTLMEIDGRGFIVNAWLERPNGDSMLKTCSVTRDEKNAKPAGVDYFAWMFPEIHR